MSNPPCENRIMNDNLITMKKGGGAGTIQFNHEGTNPHQSPPNSVKRDKSGLIVVNPLLPSGRANSARPAIR
jgi:hypothetical protein